jgi:hypothetical protein
LLNGVKKYEKSAHPFNNGSFKELLPNIVKKLAHHLTTVP